jgi:hypothetical protein
MILAYTLSTILGAITLTLILVQDVIIANNLSWKTVIVIFGAIISPPIAGYLYSAVRAVRKH